MHQRAGLPKEPGMKEVGPSFPDSEDWAQPEHTLSFLTTGILGLIVETTVRKKDPLSLLHSPLVHGYRKRGRKEGTTHAA